MKSNHDECKLYYEISYDEIKVYYYDDEELFDVNKDINILRQFFKKCKFNRNNWNLTDTETPILNLKKEDKYSNIIFKRNFKFLTRLDNKKQFFLHLKKKKKWMKLLLKFSVHLCVAVVTINLFTMTKA